MWHQLDINDVCAWEKSRRTGFSWAAAAPAASYAAAAKSAGGMDVMYMGYERDMTREFIDYVAMWAKVFQLAAGAVEEFVWRDPDHPERDIAAFRIRFASGFEVIALPSVPRALRGKQGLVILDEAAFMDDLKGALKAALAFLIWGGKVLVISTHNGDTNEFNVLINDIRSGKLPYFVGRLTFDEAVEQGLYRRVCLTQGVEWTPEGEEAWRAKILAIYADNADEELNVIPNPSTGAYLPGTLLEARTVPDVPVLRWEQPTSFKLQPEEIRLAVTRAWCEDNLGPVVAQLQDEPHAFGEDFGRIIDLTVIWLLAICRDLSRRTRIIVELRNIPFEQQRQILFWLLDRVPRLRAGAMDAGGNGAYLAEVAQQRFGERIQLINLSEPWYRENMPPMKAAIEDDNFSLPKDRDVIDDLRNLRLVRGVARVPERTRTDEGASRHGDAAIAAALAFAASRAEPEEYDYRASNRAPALDGPAERRYDRPDDDDDRRPRRHRELRGSI
ncbi:hypothetical protein [Acidisoma sp. 7E03]